MKDIKKDKPDEKPVSVEPWVWKFDSDGEGVGIDTDSVQTRSLKPVSSGQIDKPQESDRISSSTGKGDTDALTSEPVRKKSMKELWGWAKYLPDKERSEVEASLASLGYHQDEMDSEEENSDEKETESTGEQDSEESAQPVNLGKDQAKQNTGKVSLDLMGMALAAEDDGGKSGTDEDSILTREPDSTQLKELWSWAKDNDDEELASNESDISVRSSYPDDEVFAEDDQNPLMEGDFSDGYNDENSDYLDGDEYYQDDVPEDEFFNDDLPGTSGDSDDIELVEETNFDDEFNEESEYDPDDITEVDGPFPAGKRGTESTETESPLEPEILPGPVKIPPQGEEDDKDKEEEKTTADNLQRNQSWGYGFVLFTLFTMFGSITIATYLVFLRSNMSIPNIIVYVSVVALLVFLGMLILRYVVLIFLSFMHHNRNKAQDRIVIPDLKATILVPAFNEEKVIERSILSLLELNYPEYEIIVINDGSTDKTLKVARKLEGMHGDVSVRVLTQRNLGKAQALNHGAKEATGDVLICMDGDSRLSIDCLLMGMRHFIDPEIGSVAGNVKVLNRVNLWTRLQALEYIEGLNLVRRAQAFLRVVNIVPGPIGFFRRSAILEVGGWDNDTFAEDCDLTLKLLTHGYRIDYEPESISYTEAPEKLIQLLKQRYRWTRGILQSMRKHSSFLINPRPGWRVMIIMWQMVFEAIIWPLMNVLANVLFLIVALLFGMSPLIVLWWVQLTILDVIAAIHTVAIERENLMLVPLAVVYRLFFIQLVDVAKLIATIEELLNVKMGWGKIERIGRL